MSLELELRNASLVAGAALAALLGGCSVPNDKPPALAVHLTHQSVAAGTPIQISGDNLAYLADEATTGTAGTDFNHDGDTLDSVPVVVNLATTAETVIAVQANSIAWLNSDLFFIVDEAKDNRDWNGDGNKTSLVLLHWSAAFPTSQFIDTVAADPNPGAPTPRMIATPGNLFYVSGGPAPTGAHTSTIHFVSAFTPLMHAQVPTDDATASLSPSLLAVDEGLLFLALNEVTEARDLNNDTDSTDQYVLALLNGTNTTPTIRDTHLAMANGTGPFRAAVTTTPNDWQVGFLVSEAAQGGTNFNNPTVGAANLPMSWTPPQCVGFDDNDTSDNVLFYILFANWVNDPVANPPRNTGLVGSQEIAMANGFVATISVEADEGTCDLNSDGDTTDHVVRATQMVTGTPAVNPIIPLKDASNIHAVFDVPGGTHGLSELQQGGTRVLVAVVSEAADNKDLNGDGQKTFNLVGWLLPSNPNPNEPVWDFTHSSGNNAFVGASWLGEEPDHARVEIALQEAVNGSTLNPGGDGDALDSVPTFAVFSGSNLVFPGVAVAVQQSNAGITALDNFGFFRVDEAADNRDWNGDGDKNDIVLMRVSFSQSTTAVMGTLLQGLNGPVIPVQFGVTQNGGAFVFNEAGVGGSGSDISGDGTIHPFVAWFHF